MFERTPFEVNIRSYEELDERINALINLHSLGFTSEFFKVIITNLANGRREGQVKNLTIQEWVDAYHNEFRPIEVTVEQLQALFDHLIHFHVDIINHGIGDKYTFRHPRQIDFDNNFLVEYSILRTLDLKEN
ncbi:hypothetical protein HC174_08675 [Salinimicrobium sp. CDJ15-81-2]|nr:hypothetical protein [Salinimicrobium nanhaiense]